MPSLCYRDVHPCLPQRETNQSQHTCIALMQEAWIEMNVAPINNNQAASGSEIAEDSAIPGPITKQRHATIVPRIEGRSQP